MAARPLSLTRRLMAMVLGFVLAAWLVTALVAWFTTEHELSELLDAHLAQTTALLLASELDVPVEDDARPAPVLLRKYQSRVAFQIWRDGRLRARSTDAPEEPLAPAGVQGLSEQRLAGKRWRVFTAEQADARGSAITVHVAEQLSARRHVLLASLRGTLLPLLLVLPLLAVGVGWTVRRALRPLHALGHRVAARSPRALDALPQDGVPAEVQPLVHALNGLLGRGAEQVAGERRFTADAAHELRTPIAAIRMQAQVAQGATQDEERRAALDATIAGCDRATRLVDQLLQLARLEADAVDIQPAAGRDIPTDLTAVAARLVRELSDAARARGQQIRLECPPRPVDVPMSAALAAVLLRNLLDNALRYGPDGGTVAVQLLPAQATHGVRLCVEDAGPGLSDADLARLGERFFRVLGSGQSGSGLGWSIVRRLARLHALQLHIDRSPALGGLRVTVDWPRA
ncbi:MAG TPA: histidine kinase dimerization/phospho-acceptor domain-containing protein [Ottowia sp.]|nr:histidine kinase dimerization/phospho-acceptor domain-containing protein [Ottowia sp.]